MYFVYAIGKNLTEPYSDCYIGVTNNIKLRWYHHTRSKYIVGKYIRKHHLQFQEHMKILYSGTENECFRLEETLRPNPYMGLNEAIGGKGGYSSYSAERNSKISMALTGIVKTVTQRNNISIGKKNTQMGNTNPNAKHWKITSPIGTEFIIDGTLQRFCNEHQLLSSTLRYHTGIVVPDLTSKRGGYRPKTQQSHKYRINTIGWKLEELV